jgi:hypothetical protein
LKKTISTPTQDGFIPYRNGGWYVYVNATKLKKKNICFFCAIEAIGRMFRQQNYRKWGKLALTKEDCPVPPKKRTIGENKKNASAKEKLNKSTSHLVTKLHLLFPFRLPSLC